MLSSSSSVPSLNASEEDKVVGFIGFGGMGNPIATNILKAGFSIRAYNRTSEKVLSWYNSLPDELKDKVEVVNSPNECVCRHNGIVVSMVLNDNALESISKSILVNDGLGSGGIHLSLSTVSESITNTMSTLHQAAGASYISCPVFGRPPVAAAAKLVVIPAGPHDAVKRVDSILKCISQKIVHVGDNPSNASILKLCGNYMILAMCQSMAESFTLAESHGIPRSIAYELIASPTGVFASIPIMQGYGRMIADNEYPVGFLASNGLKDATLICDAAEAGGVNMDIAELVKDKLTRLVHEDKQGDADWSSFAKYTVVNKKRKLDS